MAIKRSLKNLLIILGITTLSLLYSCDIKVSAFGYPRHILVVADSSLWQEFKGQFLEVFEAPVYMPVTETEFEVEWIPLKKLNEFKNRMNLFFLGVVEEENNVSDYLKQVLPAAFIQGVKDNQYFYLFKDDLFARDQISAFILARDRSSLQNNFEILKDEIYQSFSGRYFARLKREMFDRDEQKNIEKIIYKNFGWSVRVQHDYFIAMQDALERYVWLRRIEPDRWLSMWELEGNESMLQRDSLIAIRNKVLGRNYEGDQVVEEDTYITMTKLSDYPAHKLVGVWRNDSLYVGGPFRMYAIHDPEKSRLYFVDIAVLAPDKAKKPFIDQLEVIANTFRIAPKE
mgnify:CR=1 FL=1